MNEISYTRIGDYLLPDIILSEQPREVTQPLGRYGRMHRAFLKEHKPILYNELLLTEKLFPILRQIDEAANARLANAFDSDKTLIIQGIMDDLVYS